MPEVHVCIEGQEIGNDGKPTGRRLDPRPKKKVAAWYRIKSLGTVTRDLYAPGRKCIEIEAYLDVPRFEDGKEGRPRCQVEIRVCPEPGKPRASIYLNSYEAGQLMEFLAENQDLHGLLADLQKEDQRYRSAALARKERDREFRAKQQRRYDKQAQQADAAKPPKTGKTAKKKASDTMSESC